MTLILSRIPRIVVVVAVLVTSLASCDRSPEPGTRLLTTLPATYSRRSAVVSADGARWAYVESVATAGQRVVANGFTGTFHERAGWMRFAPKTNHLFFWAVESAGERVRVLLVTPKGPIETGFTRPGQLAFSADGTRWGAFGAVEEKAPDAAAAEGGSGTRLRATIWIDGVEVGRWAKSNVPAFGPDGAHAAYVYEDDEGRGALVADGATVRAITPVENVCAKAQGVIMSGGGDVHSASSVRYLADGSLLAVTREAEGYVVRRDDERLASYVRTLFQGPGEMITAPREECSKTSAIAPRWFRLAADAPVATWWERIEGQTDQWRVVRDGKPIDDVTCDAPWEEEPPQISDDGNAVAYPCVHRKPPGAGEVTVVTPGGRRHGPYAAIWGISFSDDGAHVAWGASNGALERPWSIVRDGAPVVEGYRAVFRPRFTPDGAHVVWQAERERNGRGVLGIDRHRFANFEELQWGPEFPSSDRVSWVVRRGHRLVRLTKEAP